MPITPSECLYFPDMVIDHIRPDVIARLVLCWDSIYTIVPEGMTRPSKKENPELSDLGIVRSLPVAPYSKAVRLAGDAVDKVFDQGGLEIILRDSEDGYTALYDRKITDKIRTSLHYGKLPSEFSGPSGARKDRYWIVSRKFASAYMAVLAKYMADQHHLSLATDKQHQFDLSTLATLGRPAPPGDLAENQLLEPENNISYGQSLLHQLIVRDIRIDPETPLGQLVRFRQRYSSEVTRYRVALQHWAADQDLVEALLHSDEGRFGNWYKQEIQAPLADLSSALRGMGISCAMEQAVKISALSSPVSGLAIAAGLSPTAALSFQAVVSLASSIVKVRADQQKLLSDKPYAYLYRLQRKFRG